VGLVFRFLLLWMTGQGVPLCGLWDFVFPFLPFVPFISPFLSFPSFHSFLLFIHCIRRFAI
jgi:hypothetical protein